MTKKIYIGGDHSSPEFKQEIINHFTKEGYQMVNLGTDSFDSVDYPDYGIKVAERVASDDKSLGIIICGTGIGISIAANKVHGIRAALLYNKETAELAKQHNNANVIAFGARMFDVEEIIEMITIFLTNKFLGGRHANRLKKIADYENEHIISSIDPTVYFEPTVKLKSSKVAGVTANGTFINDLEASENGAIKIESLNDDDIKALTTRSSKPSKFSKKEKLKINESNHLINDPELLYARGHDWTLTKHQVEYNEQQAKANDTKIIKNEEPVSEKNVDEELEEIMNSFDESILDD